MDREAIRKAASRYRNAVESKDLIIAGTTLGLSDEENEAQRKELLDFFEFEAEKQRTTFQWLLDIRDKLRKKGR